MQRVRHQPLFGPRLSSYQSGAEVRPNSSHLQAETLHRRTAANDLALHLDWLTLRQKALVEKRRIGKKRIVR